MRPKVGIVVYYRIENTRVKVIPALLLTVPANCRRPDLRKTSSVLGVNVAMFQCNPKIKGEKMTFGWVDKEYLDQSIANIEE
eukprot:8452049-Prorocentrum_lima.AAC.1